MEAQTPQSFTFGNRIDKTFNEVNGMVVDKDDNLILADGSLLQKYNPDGECIKECILGGDACDISYHKNTGRIVVALKSTGIQFVDNFTAQKWIMVQNMAGCRGVTWVDDQIYVGGDDEHDCSMIFILDYHGNYINVHKCNSSFIYHLYHRDNHIYYTDSIKLYCMERDGSNLVTVSVPDLLWTRGIVTDRPGNVYVAALGSHKIVRLSPDGQNPNIVLTQENRIQYPHTLCFNRDYTKLFVSNEAGKRVDMYNCQY